MLLYQKPNSNPLWTRKKTRSKKRKKMEKDMTRKTLGI